MGKGQDLESFITRKLFTMKKRIAVAGSFIALSWLCVVAADTLFTAPFIVVTPETLDFGVVRPRHSTTNCLLVENVGGGTLVGTATVPPPFKIISGAKYSLKQDEAQIVTIVYTPDGALTNTQVATFTGGVKEVKATFMGRMSTKPEPYYPKRK
jgi:hypothetical protein